MKKSLLKASLICLGITLLCGLYSFRIPEGENLQQRFRTASISNDTLITPDGEEAQSIKEVVVESDQGDCECVVTLKIVSGYTSHDWELIVTNPCHKSIVASCNYDITTAPGRPNCYTIYEEGEVEVKQNGSKTIASGSYECSYCEPISVSAHFK